MKRIAVIAGALMLTGLGVANAQTADPAPRTQHEKVQSSEAVKSGTTYSSASLKTADLTRMRSEKDQLQFLKPQQSEKNNTKQEVHKSYNPISIPLW